MLLKQLKYFNEKENIGELRDTISTISNIIDELDCKVKTIYNKI